MPEEMNVNGLASSPRRHTIIAIFLRGAGLNIVLVFLSGLLASCIFLPHAIWWLAWVALVPLLIALRRTTAVRAAGWLMLLFGLVFFAGALPWLRTIFAGSVIGIYTLISLPLILFGLAYRALIGTIATWRSRNLAFLVTILLAPVCWLAIEWLRCEGWYFRFSWAQLGFALTATARGFELYPHLGVYGVTFLMLLTNAVLVEILLVQQHRWKKMISLSLVLALIVLFSLYLNTPARNNSAQSTPTRTFRAAIVQNETGNLGDLKEQTLELASLKPALVVWPEYAILDYPLSDTQLLGELQALARTMDCTLILGCKEHLPDNTRVDWLRRRGMMTEEGALFANMALIIGPDGTVLGKYHKMYPIQFFADGVPGKRYSTFATPVGRLGIGICYDFDFASTPLRLVHNRAEILVSPTYDSIEWTALQHDQHARMAQARAAETGRYLIRPTTSGLSQIINPTGRMTAVIPNGDPGAASAIVHTRRQQTLYVRVLYRLPHLCLALILLASTLLFMQMTNDYFKQKNHQN